MPVGHTLPGPGSVAGYNLPSISPKALSSCPVWPTVNQAAIPSGMTVRMQDKGPQVWLPACCKDVGQYRVPLITVHAMPQAQGPYLTQFPIVWGILVPLYSQFLHLAPPF